MLSQTAEYALRAVVLLAEHEPGVPARVGELATALDIPQNYLSKTLHLLSLTGVLTSTRGKGGGFMLARPASEITLFEVVDPFDRRGARSACLMGQGECSEAHACAAHAIWKAVSQQVQTFFLETTLADLGGKPKRTRSPRRPTTRQRTKKMSPK